MTNEETRITYSIDAGLYIDNVDTDKTQIGNPENAVPLRIDGDAPHRGTLASLLRLGPLNMANACSKIAVRTLPTQSSANTNSLLADATQSN